MEFGKAFEDLSWNHCTSTPHRSETNGIAERAVRRVKEGTSAVLLQSGLNESWWADSMECYTYLRNCSGELRIIFRVNLRKFLIGLTIVGKRAWQQEEERKGDISTALIFQEQLFISELFKDIQDATLLILHCRIGCAFNLHSIINNGLISGGQNSSKRQTVFFLPIDPRDKGHKDPEKIDLNVPRRAQYLHSACKKHQDAVYWVDIDLPIRKGLTFYQTRSNAIILQGTLPACSIPKVIRLKTGEVLYEKA